MFFSHNADVVHPQLDILTLAVEVAEYANTFFNFVLGKLDRVDGSEIELNAIADESHPVIVSLNASNAIAPLPSIHKTNYLVSLIKRAYVGTDLTRKEIRTEIDQFVVDVPRGQVFTDGIEVKTSDAIKFLNETAIVLAKASSMPVDRVLHMLAILNQTCGNVLVPTLRDLGSGTINDVSIQALTGISKSKSNKTVLEIDTVAATARITYVRSFAAQTDLDDLTCDEHLLASSTVMINFKDPENIVTHEMKFEPRPDVHFAFTQKHDPKVRWIISCSGEQDIDDFKLDEWVVINSKETPQVSYPAPVVFSEFVRGLFFGSRPVSAQSAFTAGTVEESATSGEQATSDAPDTESTNTAPRASVLV